MIREYQREARRKKRKNRPLPQLEQSFFSSDRLLLTSTRSNQNLNVPHVSPRLSTLRFRLFQFVILDRVSCLCRRFLLSHTHTHTMASTMRPTMFALFVILSLLNQIDSRTVRDRSNRSIDRPIDGSLGSKWGWTNECSCKKAKQSISSSSKRIARSRWLVCARQWM